MSKTNIKQTKFYHGLITMLIVIVAIVYMVVICGAEPHIPLLIGCVAAAAMALYLGYSWNYILDAAVEGIRKSIEANIILLIIGILIAVWMASGTIPSLIYYGLKILKPQYFLITVLIICTAISMVMGSWGTAGTVGVAFIGIGQVLNIDMALTAGAIVSGAYVGSIISPLSDVANMTSGILGKPVMSMIKRCLPIVLPVCLISMVIYGVYGLGFAGDDAALLKSGIQPYTQGLEQAYNLSPICFLPILAVALCIIFKIPAIPSILAGIAAGFVVALTVQGETMPDLLAYSYSGYVSGTSVETLDNLLTVGGITSMTTSLTVVIIAMGFGGIMDKTHMMTALMHPLTKRTKSELGMSALAASTCVVMNAVIADQYLGVSIPAQMYKQEYEDKKMDLFHLSNMLGCAGAATSPLIPWSTCGLYMTSVLGVSGFLFWKYSYLNLMLPFAALLYMAIKMAVKRGKKTKCRKTTETVQGRYPS